MAATLRPGRTGVWRAVRPAAPRRRPARARNRCPSGWAVGSVTSLLLSLAYSYHAFAGEWSTGRLADLFKADRWRVARRMIARCAFLVPRHWLGCCFRQPARESPV